MKHTDFEALYLGGHPRFPATTPVTGQVRLADDGVHFMVMGEFYDTLFAVAWSDIDSWDVEGPSVGQRHSTGGRAAVGALLAGVPGAIIGLAAVKESYQAVLVVRTGGEAVAFVIRDRAPAAVVAAMRTVPELGERQGSIAPAQTVAWECLTASLSEFDALGKEGWEPVGVWVQDDQPQVLLKRPII